MCSLCGALRVFEWLSDWVMYGHCMKVIEEYLMYKLVAMDNLGIYSCRMIWFITTNKQQ